MKIAQVAPLHESVPPSTYGGTERVVHYLTEELTALGHEVSLFASGDSQTSAELIPVVGQSLRKSTERKDIYACYTLAFSRLLEQITDFDVVHFHTEYFQFMLSQHLNIPHLSTIHGRLDRQEYIDLFKNYQKVPVVSISNNQRSPIAKANWISTIYNGVPAKNFDFKPVEDQDYLVFIGRISPLKNPVDAIKIAIQTNTPIKIAAKIDNHDMEYFEAQVKPYLSHPLVDFIGEVNEAQKNELLGDALGLIFPIHWPEPFGLVMIESLACGTPVIAYNQGAVSEVMINNTTGFIVESLEEACKQVDKLKDISREDCRKHFEDHFSARAMANNYVSTYEHQIHGARASLLQGSFKNESSKERYFI